jgi:E3 ubiquitin-protein ligase RNF14
MASRSRRAGSRSSVSRSETLFRFILHIEDESCTAFGLQKLSVVSELIPQLLEFDRTAKKEMFDKESFECGICLDREMGSTCYHFEHCKHISCISCLQECFNRAIVAGSVDEVQCPSVDCGVEKQDTSSRRVKKVRLISPQELLRIPIERAAVQRFVDMKRKKMLESDPSTIWCPRKWCQSAAINKKYPKPTVPLEEMDESYDIEEATSTPVPDDSDDEATKDKKILDDRLRTCENEK